MGLVSDLIDGAAETLGGPPLRIAVWVGIGVSVGLSLKRDDGDKSDPEATENPIHLAIVAGDFKLAEEIIRRDSAYDRQPGALAQLRAIQDTIADRLRKRRVWNEHIGELVDSQRYGEAISFVRSLNIDPSERKIIVSNLRLDEEQRKKRDKWDQQLRQLLSDRKYEKAITFVKNLDVIPTQRDEVINRIRQEMRLAEQKKNAPIWDAKINQLVAQQQFDEAIRFVESIDILPEQRDVIVTQIRGLEQENRKTNERIEESRAWNQTITTLVGGGHFDQAIKFAKGIGIDPAQRTQILAELGRLKQAALIEKKARSEKARVAKLVAQEKFDDAIELLYALPLPIEEREDAIHNIIVQKAKYRARVPMYPFGEHRR